MPANIVAGIITFLKIGIDFRDGAEIKTGDIVSLVGNVAGVIATVAILGGAAPALVAGLGVVTIIAGLYSIVESDTFKNITANAAKFFEAACWIAILTMSARLICRLCIVIRCEMHMVIKCFLVIGSLKQGN